MTADIRPPEVGPWPEKGARVCLDGLPNGPWLATVESRPDDDTLVLAFARRGGLSVVPPVGRRFVVAYSVREVPCEVDVVSTAGSVPGPGEATDGNGAPTFLVNVVRPPRRMQRRGAVRVPVQLIVRATASDSGDEVGATASTIAAITENLSAGGALLRMPEAVAPGSRITVTLAPGALGPAMELPCRVVRCDREIVGAGRHPWRIALAFADLTSAQEDRLVRYVFTLQRDLRRRETGLDA